jgi:transcriptional repressor NrdR
VGLAILAPLRELDQVAYLRFASVYKSFDSLDEFEKEAGRERRWLGRTSQGGNMGGHDQQGNDRRPRLIEVVGVAAVFINSVAALISAVRTWWG